MGDFLIALAIDLAVNGTAGMSLGLRLFLDRNSAHKNVCLFRGDLSYPNLDPIVIGSGRWVSPTIVHESHHRWFNSVDVCT